MKKLFKTLLACLLAFTCIASVATVSASATDYSTHIDYYGENICDNMEIFITGWLERFFTQDIQVGGHAETLIFVDYELINYGFLNHICQALNSNLYIPRKSNTTLYWGNIYEQTGIRFLVDLGNNVYCDLEQWQYNGDLMGFDFSDVDNTFDAFCDTYVNEVNMFAIGVWYPGNTFWEPLKIPTLLQ